MKCEIFDCPQNRELGTCNLVDNPPSLGDQVDVEKCYHRKFTLKMRDEKKQ